MSAITIEQWERQLRELETGGMRGALRELLAYHALQAESQAKLNAGPPRLRVRSGALRRSIEGEVQESGDQLDAVLEAGGKEAPYAAMQEHGGTVSPKGKYLAIPFGAALTAAGAVKARFKVGSLRNVANLFVVRKRDGRLFLAWREGNALQMGFRLHPGPVRVPEHRFLRDARDAQVDPMVRDIQELMVRALQPGGEA